MKRTGKLHGQTKVMIPYHDAEGSRHWNMITVTGTIYASKVYAGIRKFVLDNFGTKVNNDWLDNVPVILNTYDPDVVQLSEEEKKHIVDAFIDRVELKDDAETESDTDSADQSEAPAQAG